MPSVGWFLAGVRMAVLLLSLAAISRAQQLAYGESRVPTAASYPEYITVGPDGALWFTENGGNKIGRITKNWVITEYALPEFSEPEGIASGPDGALWFAACDGNYIGRITTAGVVTEYPAPTADSCPLGITAGPDGALWFTEGSDSRDNNIGRITTAGVFSEYPVASAGSRFNGITTGPDGALWFTDLDNSRIGRITMDGVVSEYALATGSYPWWIVTGPDGALWFTEADGIGRITTAGSITEYHAPGEPYGITAGPDDALWFTAMFNNKIGRVTTGGVVSEYAVPNAVAPFGIVAGPDRSLWFAEFNGNKIDEAVFTTADLSVSPASGTYYTDLTFTGSGFAPGGSVRIYQRGIGSAELASAAADASGSFTVSARAPESPYGVRLFLGEGQSSGKLGAASFSVAPRLVLSSHSGPAGSSVTATGYGFGPLETVKILWKFPRRTLGTVTSDVNGTFHGSTAFTFTVPADATGGLNGVSGFGETTLAKDGSPFTVE